MTRAERILGVVLVLACLVVLGLFWLQHYGAVQYTAGYAAAAAEGQASRDALAEIYRQTEDDLRAKLYTKDDIAIRKDKEHAQSLAAAQRRMLTGDDRMRCPASPLQASTSTGDRPAATGPAPQPEGPELVPTASADLLGVAADIAGLVRRYERLEERFEACRILNAK